MASRIEMKKDDLKAAIENYARIQFRAARNTDIPEIAKIYEQLGKYYSDALQTIMEVK